jgi:hypothetical protein
MVPETCLEEMELQTPPGLMQQPRQPLEAQPSLQLPPAGRASGGGVPSNERPAGAPGDTPKEMAAGAAAAAASALANDNGSGVPATPSAQGAADGVQDFAEETPRQPPQHQHDSATPTASGAAAAAVTVPSTASDPDCPLAGDANPLCLPVPPPGYDFDLDAAPEPGLAVVVAPPAAAQLQQQRGVQDGFRVAGAAAAGRAGSSDAVNAASPSPGGAALPVFDYLLDEPTPPPKQLPKGNGLLPRCNRETVSEPSRANAGDMINETAEGETASRAPEPSERDESFPYQINNYFYRAGGGSTGAAVLLHRWAGQGRGFAPFARGKRGDVGAGGNARRRTVCHGFRNP